jgi:ubiquinone/menaquinone biosynthesis C-methylase UbiE
MPNPFDDENVAKRYEGWYAGHGRRADYLEKHLLARLLANISGAGKLLEVGCGTGHFSRWLAEKGFGVVGLDISPAMLTEARRRNGISYVVGDALALPFVDRSFGVVALITTLEFVADPQRALSEAVRVARDGLLLGVLSRYSLLAIKHRIGAKPPWDAARFFSPDELAALLRSIASARLARIEWRTTLWPVPGLKSVPLPWGGFIGMVVQLRQE